MGVFWGVKAVHKTGRSCYFYSKISQKEMNLNNMISYTRPIKYKFITGSKF